MALEVRIRVILEAQRLEAKEKWKAGGLWNAGGVQFVKIHQALNLHFAHFSVWIS